MRTRRQLIGLTLAGLAVGCAAVPPDRQVYAPGEPLPHRVAFACGDRQLAGGDAIDIGAVRGTSRSVASGNVYLIRGTYTLASRGEAVLAAFVTAVPGDNRPGGPTLDVQQLTVTRGRGSFALYLPMATDGRPHVSFYPIGGGESFGTVYFHTDPVAWRQGE